MYISIKKISNGCIVEVSGEEAMFFKKISLAKEYVMHYIRNTLVD
jgi:hypothetical protein